MEFQVDVSSNLAIQFYIQKDSPTRQITHIAGSTLLIYEGVLKQIVQQKCSLAAEASRGSSLASDVKNRLQIGQMSTSVFCLGRADVYKVEWLRRTLSESY